MANDGKIVHGRFNRSQVSNGIIKDLIDNPNVEDVICITKFKDGSMDVFGMMMTSDICFGIKILEQEILQALLDIVDE